MVKELRDDKDFREFLRWRVGDSIPDLAKEIELWLIKHGYISPKINVRWESEHFIVECETEEIRDIMANSLRFGREWIARILDEGEVVVRANPIENQE